MCNKEKCCCCNKHNWEITNCNQGVIHQKKCKDCGLVWQEQIVQPQYVYPVIYNHNYNQGGWYEFVWGFGWVWRNYYV